MGTIEYKDTNRVCPAGDERFGYRVEGKVLPR